MIEDKTKEIFDEEYSKEYILELVKDYLVRFPNFDKARTIQAIEATVIIEEKTRRYYAQDSSIISHHLLEQAKGNKSKGYSNE